MRSSPFPAARRKMRPGACPMAVPACRRLVRRRRGRARRYTGRLRIRPQVALPMRNDSLDELDDALPSLVSEQREPPAAVERGAVRPSRGAPLALWGLLLVLTLALAALG